MSENKKISRKSFLKGMGTTVAGVAVGGLLAGCSNEPTASASGDPMEAPQWPFTYKKIDPAVAQERAYEMYFEKGGWGVGVSEGFFGTLADEVGYPFNQIPTETFINAAGGFNNATLCGCLGVAAACAGSVCEGDEAKEVISELVRWYKQAEFPTYQPEGLDLPTTVAESELCGDSVGKFMDVSGFAYGDHERKARCAGVTGETVHKLVEILNERKG